MTPGLLSGVSLALPCATHPYWSPRTGRPLFFKNFLCDVVQEAENCAGDSQCTTGMKVFVRNKKWFTPQMELAKAWAKDESVFVKTLKENSEGLKLFGEFADSVGKVRNELDSLVEAGPRTNVFPTIESWYNNSRMSDHLDKAAAVTSPSHCMASINLPMVMWRRS